MRRTILRALIAPLWVFAGIGSYAAGQDATVVMQATGPTTISAGQPLTIELFAENVYDAADPTPKELQGYQSTLEVVAGTGAVGTLGLDDPPADNIFVDTTRPDWVFAAANGPFDVTNAAELKLGAVVFSPPFVQVTTRRYLGTYIFAAQSGTLGDFTIRFKPVDPGNPDVIPNQLLDQNGLIIPTTFSPSGGITVSVVDQAINDSCAAALSIDDGVTPFNTANATTDGPSHGGSGCDQGGSSTISNDIWYDYVATCSGVLVASTCGSADFDTRLAIYNGCFCPVSDGNLLVCNDNAPGCSGFTSEAVVEGVFQNDCYKIRLGATGDLTGLGSLSVNCIGNDICSSPDPISIGSTTQGTTRGTSVNDAAGLNCGQGFVDSPGVWYSVVGTGDRLRASIPSASYDTRLTVYQGGCGSLSCVGDANVVGASGETVDWCTTAGVTYRILVHGVGGASGTFSLSVTSATCNDQNACTTDSCSNGTCSHTPNYDAATFCCTPSSGNVTLIDDGNPCTNDVCNTLTGVVTHPSRPNGPNVGCDDALRCTLDECFNAQCRNTDINSIACASNANCPPDSICGDGTGETQDGFCFCQSGPTLELVAQPGSLPGDECYGLGDTVTVLVEMGAAEDDPIVGAQFFLEYDPSTLDLVSIDPGSAVDASSPFSLELRETINEVAGTIDYIVGLDFGSTATFGPATVAAVTFQLAGECDGFVRFRPGPSGQENLLTASGGASVTPVLIDAPSLNIDFNPPTTTSCPSDRVVPPDPGEITAVVTWATPTASDTCDPSVSMICDPPSGFAFPPGPTTVTCTATDSCGLADTSCSFTVTVEPPILTIDTQLSTTVDPGPFERCITFEFWDCDGPANARHAVVEQNLTFVNGMASAAEVPMPGGTWECVTVRDRLHTLRSKAPDFGTTDGIHYTASVMGSRGQGGHWLVGGNLNDDDFIDILDFGVLFPLHLSLANGGTPCGSAAPDGNINGDNLVDLLDLVIFVGNSFLGAEPDCCASGTTARSGGGPVTSISVEELVEQGLDGMIAADVNGDGMLDMDDVITVLQGNVGRPGDEPGPRRSVVKPYQRRGARR